MARMRERPSDSDFELPSFSLEGQVALVTGGSRGLGLGIARALLHDAYASLDAVGAIDGADADRLVDLGVRRAVIEVTGDTGYDQVWERAVKADRSKPPLAALDQNRPTIVAGSTWPADEAVLLPAFAHLLRVSPDLRLIIAPHELTRDHVAAVYEWARRGAGE